MIRAMEPTLTPELEALLHAWLPQQRWFPVKSGEFSLTPSARMAVGEPSALVGLEILILTLHFTASDGSARSEVIQVPLSNRSAELGTADLALVGQLVDQEHGERWVYDALHDPVFVASWLDFLATESHSSGAIVGHSSSAFRASRTPGSLGRSRVLGGEQSNTSVVIPNSALPVILKFFRVLSPGDNPEVVVGSALTEAGCTEVPAVHGWATGEWLAGGQQVSGHLCVMAEFIRGSEDVWSLAVASARAGSTFTHQAVRLGAALAHVHTSLQGALGSHVASADERDALLNALAGRIRWAWGMAAAAVGPYEQQVDALLAQLPEEKELPLLQRIHGDLHLGQILHAGTPDGLVADRWLILDFEGEPLRPVSERNADDVAVRDVVGLLRSFDYAAAAAQSEEPEAVAVPAGWADECATALLAGYQQAGGVAIDQDSPLFLALWLDKALYEVVYELRNRPHWVHIPVAAVRWALERNESGEPMKSIHGENSAASSASVPAAAVPATPGTEPEPTPTASVPVPVPVEADVLARVAEASYHAPHSVLGGHVGDDGAVTIRSVRHLASAVTLVTEAGRTPMTHELGGVWVATVDPLVPGHTPDYRLEVEYPDGFMTLADDPYRFLPTVGELDLHLMGEGRHESLWQVLGAHVHRYPSALGDVQGVGFSVWAPNAQAVRVKGEFNKWDARHHGMRTLGSSGVWELFIPDVVPGARYKYEILTRSGQWIEKADPMAYGTEVPPLTASRVVESSYEFKDSDWLAARAQRDPHNSPMSVYEVHLGSWRLGLDYTQLARELVEYVQWMGFTHVELMPVAEHPFGGSWGYQVTSYYAPTSRFGHPDEFRFLVDSLHQAGIGVIMDWVPAHFPKDEWALAKFDGEPLYEHSDPRLGEHPDWGTLIFNFGRSEVRNFLVANALYWIEEFHIDGLRVDAVASMLYLDYSREEGQWSPNRHGGRENLEAISFLQEMSATVYKRNPGAITIAEESTAFPGVTAPTDANGLGFGLKWNMGWMHDSLAYMAEDPINRSWHHGKATFSLVYAFTENFLLPISHDEVVHGKGSMLRKMPGDRWQQLANLRAYLAFQWAHPGKQLIFMGTEFGQEAEWSEQYGLDWWLADTPPHRGLQLLVKELNARYSSTPALYKRDNEAGGFDWINANDAEHNVLSFVRWDHEGHPLVCVVNFGGHPHEGYKLGLPSAGTWHEVLNTDAAEFGGSGVGNGGHVEASSEGWDKKPASATLTLPPLGVIYLVPAQS